MPRRSTRLDPPPGFSYCTKHKQNHPIEEFLPNKKMLSGCDSWCKTARAEYQKKFQEKLGTDYGRYRRAQQRAYVIWRYGGKCARCGEANPLVLCLDHVNGDGDERGRANQALTDAINNDFPEDLQLLCYNCNALKEKEASGNAEVFDLWNKKWVEAFEKGLIGWEKGEGFQRRMHQHQLLMQDTP